MRITVSPSPAPPAPPAPRRQLAGDLERPPVDDGAGVGEGEPVADVVLADPGASRGALTELRRGADVVHALPGPRVHADLVVPPAVVTGRHPYGLHGRAESGPASDPALDPVSARRASRTAWIRAAPTVAPSSTCDTNNAPGDPASAACPRRRGRSTRTSSPNRHGHSGRRDSRRDEDSEGERRSWPWGVSSSRAGESLNTT